MRPVLGGGARRLGGAGMASGSAMVVAAVMAACGGGGGGGSTESPPPEPPVIPLPEPITEMPTSSYDGFKLEAFTRLNEARIAAGVSAVRQNAQLDAAAQAHATYLVRNYVTGHSEDPTKPYFSGVNSTDRATAHGYQGVTQGEVINYANDSAPGAAHINRLLNSVYHLGGLLIPSANEVGVGHDSTLSPAQFLSTPLTLGSTDTRLQPLAPIWTWPANRATATPAAFRPATERPNPLPDIATDDTVEVGSPIMLCGSHGNYSPLQLSRTTIEEAGTRRRVQTIVLHHPLSAVASQDFVETRTDGNLQDLRQQHCVFILSRAPWSAGTTYEVHVAGTQSNATISSSWSFTTAPDR